MIVASDQATFPGWHPHPEVWLFAIGLVVAYVWAVTMLGPRLAPRGHPIASGGQKAAFLLGVLALFLAEDWPLHELAEDYWFSAHMVQHLLFAFVIPPLLLAGTPAWLLRWILGTGIRFKVVRFVTKPLVALALFNLSIVAMHWPLVVDMQSSNSAFHLFFHVVLLSTGLAMWTVVVSPLPELNRLSDPAKMLFLFLQSIVPTVPASFLTFAADPLYSFYESAPRLWGLGADTDQMMAGLIMKLGGGLLLWSVITVMFFKWNAKEEAQSEQEVSWDDFERELDVWNMRK
jgi:putative membrane protein